MGLLVSAPPPIGRNAGFALWGDGSLTFVSDMNRPINAKHIWYYSEVKASPASFLAFLTDAKRRGASAASIIALIEETRLRAFIADCGQVLGIEG